MRNDLEQRLSSHEPNPSPAAAGAVVHDDDGRAVKLRRWSVAELLARAVPRPPASGVAH